MAIHRIIFNVAVTAAVCTISVATGGEHRIQLQRQYRKNMITQETFVITNETASGWVGTAPKESRESISLVCKVEVKSIDNARWQRLIVTPSSISSVPASLIEGVEIKSVSVDVSRDKKAVRFKRVDGKPLSEADTALLGRFFVMPNPQSQDDLFGTTEAVDVKESWNVSNTEMAAFLKQVSGGLFACAEEDVTASVTLSKLWKVRDGTLLQVDAKATFANVIANGPIAQTLKAPKVDAQFDITYHLPTDLTLPAFKTEGRLTWKASGIKKGGNKQFIVAGQLTRSHKLSVLSSGKDQTTKETNP